MHRFIILPTAHSTIYIHMYVGSGPQSRGGDIQRRVPENMRLSQTYSCYILRVSNLCSSIKRHCPITEEDVMI